MKKPNNRPMEVSNVDVDVKDPHRLGELKTALKSKVEENERIAQSFSIEDNGGVVVTTEQRDAFQKNLSDAKEIKSLIEELEGNSELKAWMDAPADAMSAAARANATQAQMRTQGKSIGELFIDSEEFKEFRQQGGASMRRPWEMENVVLTDHVGGRKDIYTGSGGNLTSPTFGRTERAEPVLRPQRQFRVRDLFPVVGTDANLIDFFRVQGFTSGATNNAATVGERTGDNLNFGAKPQSSLTFTPDQAPVRTIAHWEVAHRNIIADEPQLRGIIDNELLYGLRLAEDNQILNGDGTGDNLRGILATTGVQTYTQANDGAVTPAPTEPKADALRRAATKVMLAYYDPTGYVLHPNDWEDIELAKDADGRYLITMNVAVGAEQRMWRLPVVDTPALTEGKFITGAFGLGAQLYDREVGNIRVAEQHGDLFIRNAVVVLAEERLALAVRRPESFVNGTFVG